MDNKMLYDAVKSILLNEWDPIGISEFEEANDEYDAYITPICKMIAEGQSIVSIREYLRFATDSMCLDADETTEQIIAERLSSITSISV
jgi:hypothetical protein